MCDDIPWNPMPDFNHLRAPVGEPMVYVQGKKVSLKSCLSGLGSSLAIYHYWGAAECRAVAGWLVLNSDVIHRFVEVKNMQLVAFIAWQQFLEEKYREEKKHSLSLNRR